MPVAINLIRTLPHYRHDAFSEGLRKVGFAVTHQSMVKPKKGDVIVMWNRYGPLEKIATTCEAAGGTVIVAENAWLGADEKARQRYAICKWHHNGAGEWMVGEADRFSKLKINLKPWRTKGNHILIVPQRGIGPEGVAMPKSWPLDIEVRLRRVTQRPIMLRKHPGNDRPPLEPDLFDCHAVVTWGSGAAIKAIVAGTPVFYDMPKWIGAPAAKEGILDLENPFLGDRMPMLHRLSWAQWNVSEIANGEPFRCLLT